MPPAPKNRDVSISKALSYLLRHGAEKEKLPIDSQGWVAVDAVLSNNRIRTHKASLEDIQKIVAQNEKQRFSLRQDEAGWQICANQGHTLKTITPELTLLTKESMPRQVYHGTFKLKLASIEQEGLSRMARNHIHLTSDAAWSKLGIRASCNTLIFIDTDKCIDDGFVFWRSSNGVVLCEGNEEGRIPPGYFREIRDISGEKGVGREGSR